MPGIRRDLEFPLAEAKQVVLAQDTSNPLVVHLPTLALQLGGDARPTIGGKLQCDPLDRVAEIDVPDSGCDRRIEAVESGAAHARQSRPLLDRQWALTLLFLVDFPAEGGVGFSARHFRSSSICRKQPFKKSISIACWPIFRSSSATAVSSCRRRQAEFGRSSNCRRQACNWFGLTSNSRATRPGKAGLQPLNGRQFEFARKLPSRCGHDSNSPSRIFVSLVSCLKFEDNSSLLS